ncbi:MAG TPA: DUF1801 domain-containing protein [Pyrinomonadaceae bacterium]|nr:DUF1801 domain-containing protein [Pyrinomonadaceae bacterium]
MAEAKTKPTDQKVASFIKKIPDPQTREDCLAIAKLMKEATRSEPLMWGAAIVGFGTRRIQYAGGREADWPLIAFSPRKQNLTLYIMSGSDSHAELLRKLGKHSVGGGCLYIKRLSDIDLPTLKKLIRESVKQKQRGPQQS